MRGQPFKLASFDSKKGIIEGVGNVLNIKDSWGDVVVTGAFDRSLKEKDPREIKMLRGHQANVIVGEWTELEIRTFKQQEVLWQRGQLFLDMQDGEDAGKLIDRKALDGLSIGASIVKQIWNNETEVRELLELDLQETSVVTFPANNPSRIVSLKTAQAIAEYKRHIEDVLRDADIPKEDALRIIAEGVQLSSIRSDSGQGMNEVYAELAKLNTNIKEGLS